MQALAFRPRTDDRSEVIDRLVEEQLWAAFGMETFTNRMINGASGDENGPFMGTGYTVNACYNCGGSALSANQVNCCR